MSVDMHADFQEQFSWHLSKECADDAPDSCANASHAQHGIAHLVRMSWLTRGHSGESTRFRIDWPSR